MHHLSPMGPQRPRSTCSDRRMVGKASICIERLAELYNHQGYVLP